MEENDLKAVIISSVEEAWSRDEPVLLSDIGQLNNGVVGESAKAISGRLTTFILTHLVDDLILVRHSINRPLIGVVPKNEQTVAINNFDSYLEKRKSHSMVSRSGPRLIPGFWAAFRKVLEQNQRRYIDVSDEIKFVNVSADQSPPIGMLEIERKYIAEAQTEKDHEIYAKIANWCAANNFSLSKFERKPTNEVRSAIGLRSGRRGSLLDGLLDTLEEHDLERIVVPMDVVKKLAKN